MLLILLTAFLLDLILGDPRWLPHPVRIMGWIALKLESFLRHQFESRLRIAGVLAVILLVGGTAIWVGFSIWIANKIHPWIGFGIQVYWIYSSLALHDLLKHGDNVYQALQKHDLPKARQRVGWLVGRDTHKMDPGEIVRATLESLAENLVDGVIAPLFFAFLGGAPMAMAYKMTSTLDSMFGHKDERYLKFGWASARWDDTLNWLPARLTVPFMIISAFLLKQNPVSAWKIFRRDGRKHPSPNSGLSEATMAGALEIQLGGMNFYDGVPSPKEFLGDPIRKLEAHHIPKACLHVALTTFLIFLTLAGIAYFTHLASVSIHKG